MKKTLCILLFLLLIILCASVFAETSGSCGDTVTWTLDDNGTLTISGTGAISFWGGEYEEGFGWNRDQVRLVVVEDGITVIGSAAFDNCKNLTGIIIPASVTGIGNYGEGLHYSVAHNCPNLKAFVVAPENQVYSSKDGVLFSKDMTCLYCCPEGKTGKYIVPDTVKDIYSAWDISSGALVAFENCTKLTEVVLPKGIEYIGGAVFCGCSALKNITIPNSVTHIYDSAFTHCISLTNITIPYSVKQLESGAFYGCTSLSSITIPGSIEVLGTSVFSGCSSLTSVTMACNASRWFFSGCTSLSEVTFLDGAKRIETEAFSGCSALKLLIIPDSLSEIKDEYDIGGHSQFETCKKLTTITVSARNKSVIKFFRENGFSHALNIYDIPIADCEINNINDQIYTGKYIEPVVTVKFCRVRLTQGKDYTLSYADNKDIGKASVTVSGTGNSTGTKTVTFNIVPKAVNLSSLKAGKGQLKVKWKKSSGIDGYEIEYGLKENFGGSKKVTINNAKTTSAILEGLKAKKTYFVRIRAFKKVNGKKYHSEWSKVLKKKTK